ncbi:MAG: hypothetical protein J6O18_05140 [Bacilli bacterium]|nr:hypothetical protein [Bacilli bacterium]
MTFVDFYSNCKLCKYIDLDDSEDPCDECLANPVNMNSERPIHYEPSTKALARAANRQSKQMLENYLQEEEAKLRLSAGRLYREE